jgi:hypothetical protein
MGMSEQIVQTGSTAIWRIALIVVTLVGMAMCTHGVGKVATSGQWLSFQGIAGSLVGIVILGIVGMRLIGRPLPMIDTDRAALIAVVALAAVKVAIAAVVPLKV